MLEMWLEINTTVTWKNIITAIDSSAIPHDVLSSPFPVQHNIDGMLNKILRN